MPRKNQNGTNHYFKPQLVITACTFINSNMVVRLYSSLLYNFFLVENVFANIIFYGSLIKIMQHISFSSMIKTSNEMNSLNSRCQKIPGCGGKMPKYLFSSFFSHGYTQNFDKIISNKINILDHFTIFMFLKKL